MSTIAERLLERHRVDSERMWPAPSDLDLLAAARIKQMEEALQTIAGMYTEGYGYRAVVIARAALQPKEPK